METENCVFCKIIKGSIPCYKVYEDDYILGLLDIAKDCYGHTLVVPKKHFENVLDCDEFYLQKVVEGVKKISGHYINNCGFKAVNILNASGEEAQQSVFHLHFHILPRMSKTEFNAFPKLPGAGEELDQQLKRLKLTF